MFYDLLVKTTAHRVFKIGWSPSRQEAEAKRKKKFPTDKACSLQHLILVGGLEHFFHMGMDQYLLIPFLVGWTSIYQLFWCSPGVQGFDTLPYIGNNNPNWRTPSFFRGVGIPPTSIRFLVREKHGSDFHNPGSKGDHRAPSSLPEHVGAFVQMGCIRKWPLYITICHC